MHVLDKLPFDIQLVSGVQGLGEQRNFMYQFALANFMTGEHVLALNDDVGGLLRARGVRSYSWGQVPRETVSLTGTQSISFFFNKAFADCIRAGSYLWGPTT